MGQSLAPTILTLGPARLCKQFSSKNQQALPCELGEECPEDLVGQALRAGREMPCPASWAENALLAGPLSGLGLVVEA